MGHGSSKSTTVCAFSTADTQAKDDKVDKEGTPTSSERRLSLKRNSSKVSPVDVHGQSAMVNNNEPPDDNDLAAKQETTEEECSEDGYLSCTQLYNIMFDGQNVPYLFDPKYLLLIDARPLERYEQSHIITAKHVSVLENSFLIGRLEDYVNIVLYSDEGQIGFNDVSLTDSQLHFTSNNVESSILLGGFDSFCRKFPFLSSSEFIHTESDRATKLTTYPSIIIDHCLYQGRGEQATNSKVVNDLQISHIVNISQEHKCAFPDTIQYLSIQLDDEGDANIYSQFSRIVTFIEDAVAGDGRVLVHCNVGVSRSSSATIAYLMQTRKCSLKEAHDLVKSQRPICKPNRGFLKQLSRFEKDLFGKEITDIDEIWM